MWHRIVLEVRTESMEAKLAENDKRMAELEAEMMLLKEALQAKQSCRHCQPNQVLLPVPCTM